MIELSQPAQFFSTAAAAALGAFAAAAFGYRYAVAKFRQERRFDKQLAWYEKATSTLIGVANNLNWALAAEVAGVPEEEQRKAWAIAHNSLTNLRGLEAEAELYALPNGYEALCDAVAHVTSVARAVWMSARADAAERNAVAPNRLYEIISIILYHAASRMANDVREHLKLPELEREWRIYDKEYADLQVELAELKQKGFDFADGAWDTPARTSESIKPIADDAPAEEALTPPKPNPV